MIIIKGYPTIFGPHKDKPKKTDQQLTQRTTVRACTGATLGGRTRPLSSPCTSRDGFTKVQGASRLIPVLMMVTYGDMQNHAAILANPYPSIQSYRIISNLLLLVRYLIQQGPGATRINTIDVRVRSRVLVNGKKRKRAK